MFGLFKKDKSVILTAPLTGKMLDLAEVPDDVFANRIIGDGIAIEPTVGKLVSPVSGVIKQIFPTKHAVGIETKTGLEILIHIGIDTVELDGEGFTKLAQEGDKVEPGDELIEFDLDYIKNNATSIITPVIISNMDQIEGLERIDNKEVEAGKDEVLKVKMN